MKEAADFSAFIADVPFLCGHNILRHDLKYLRPLMDSMPSAGVVDTLYLSPLLFPERPYHALVKDDKLQADELNNPLNDAEKAQKLFYDEVNAFSKLPARRKEIYYGLLNRFEEFQGFFAFLKYRSLFSVPERAIRREFAGKTCAMWCSTRRRRRASTIPSAPWWSGRTALPLSTSPGFGAPGSWRKN